HAALGLLHGAARAPRVPPARAAGPQDARLRRRSDHLDDHHGSARAPHRRPVPGPPLLCRGAAARAAHRVPGGRRLARVRVQGRAPKAQAGGQAGPPARVRPLQQRCPKL
ncbi:hypothetical protein IWW55_004244, partial [Coemansia sp. RSA 2706]